MQLLHELAAFGRVAPVECETLDTEAINCAKLVGYYRQAIERNRDRAARLPIPQKLFTPELAKNTH